MLVSCLHGEYTELHESLWAAPESMDIPAIADRSAIVDACEKRGPIGPHFRLAETRAGYRGGTCGAASSEGLGSSSSA